MGGCRGLHGLLQPPCRYQARRWLVAPHIAIQSPEYGVLIAQKSVKICRDEKKALNLHRFSGFYGHWADDSLMV